MTITTEISLYPLTENYKDVIIQIIRSLKANDRVEVMTHAMSTYIRGEHIDVFDAVKGLYDLDVMNVTPSALSCKIINKSLPVEEGFIEF